MNLRYGKADENVLKRSVADVILHERQKIAAYDELKKIQAAVPPRVVLTGPAVFFLRVRKGILRFQPLRL